ncbi:MAG: DUF1064 domain-containing protein [Proteobacteria bacterium]|nr:DUF1064 domain-containing protein [Pseudomonadota bacterium]
MNKYGAMRTYSEICQREFASKKEATRGEALTLLERGGKINHLEYQPKFILCKKPKITYKADFRYIQDGSTVVEDVKGVLTRDTRTKLAWLKQLTGIEVKLV